MGSSPVVTSRAVGDFLKNGRISRRLTLREASEGAASHGEGIPPSTLARIEQGRLDPGVRRLAALLRLYDLSPDEVAELAELESWSVEAPAADLPTLVERGVDHWRRGEVPQALAHVIAVRRHVPSGPDERLVRQRAALNFAVFARSLGRRRIAQRLVDDLLCEGPEPALAADALVLAASLWNHRGGTEVALALLARAEARLRPGDASGRARVRHQEAKVLATCGRIAEADRALDEALAAYAQAGETHDAMTARVLRIGILESLGRRTDAVEWAAATVALCDGHRHARVGISARLELSRLLMATGDDRGARSALARARRDAARIGDRDAAAEAAALERSWEPRARPRAPMPEDGEGSR